uniref:(northern house mosquito) hypothetical protein n=1 Tax=Culex pipiens TaxID=7175 RepID=A0A8D8I563_CULPI
MESNSFASTAVPASTPNPRSNPTKCTVTRTKLPSSVNSVSNAATPSSIWPSTGELTPTKSPSAVRTEVATSRTKPSRPWSSTSAITPANDRTAVRTRAVKKRTPVVSC